MGPGRDGDPRSEVAIRGHDLQNPANSFRRRQFVEICIPQMHFPPSAYPIVSVWRVS